MGLIEKTLADLITSQHEMNNRMEALADSLDSTSELAHETSELSHKTAQLARKTADQTADTAEKTRAVVEQGRKQGELMTQLLSGLGGMAETLADHETRLKRIEGA